MALWDSCALLRFALNDGIIMGVRRMKVTHEGNNGPRILTKRYTPRGNASGGVKKILESKKRSRLGPFPLFGEWQEGRSGPSLPQFAAICCHRTVSPVHKLII